MRRSLVFCGGTALVSLLAGCGSSTVQQQQAAVPIAGQSLTLSATSFDFGQEIVGNTLTRTVAKATNSSSVAATLSLAVQGDASFAVAQGVAGECGASVAAGSSCDLDVVYTPTKTASSAAVLDLDGDLQTTVSLTGQSAVLTAGVVSTTTNPYVAQYTLSSPFPVTLTVAFGPTTAYGRATSPVTIAAAGGTASVYVAGMQAGSTNHMQAVLTFANGAQAADVDHTFTAGAALPGIPASFPVTVTGTPQPGIELIDPVAGPVPSTAIATDLAGNVIWAYPFADADANARLDPVKLLPNGHMLAMVAPISYPLGVVSAINDLREFDLVGNIVRQLSIETLNAELSVAGFPLRADVFSHDFATLPNGHTLVIVTTDRVFTDLAGLPGQTDVAADAVVDLDANWNPVWVWNEFDHFDINRRPYAFPDWMHTNSVAYSPDDGDFVVSIRHQNWIVKVNYQNGAGDGSLVWTMGEGGDFELVGGADPTDWFYAQHDAQFVGAKTAGVFQMTVMDNGDDREFPAGVVCGSPGVLPCFYTTIQELEVNETAKTATLLFHQFLSPDIYSFFGGNTELLANGDFEYALSGVTAGSLIYEVTPGATLASTPAPVWQMTLPGSNAYRGFRMPSLYPGVQWTQ